MFQKYFSVCRKPESPGPAHQLIQSALSQHGADIIHNYDVGDWQIYSEGQ
jgi:hypothetical protein